VKILVCIDGKPHSKGAIRWAIRLGLSLPAEVTALHVIDPYLKKFYNELYSQGRKRYLEYVDESLQAKADQAGREFTGMCQAQGLETRFKLRYGEPLQEILEELRQAVPDLLITGAKQLTAWGRFRSRNLPLQLLKRADTPISLISVKKLRAGLRIN
jgi:nucleotide-binding universal stress UspA family protein